MLAHLLDKQPNKEEINNDLQDRNEAYMEYFQVIKYFYIKLGIYIRKRTIEH